MPTDKRRVQALRAELVRRDLDGFLIPRADEHQGEYVPPQAQRLAWISGFTGSAGLALVQKERAVIWVDGRYTLQVRDETDADLFEPLHLVEQAPHTWLGEELGRGRRIGYDPWLHTPAAVRRMRRGCKKAGSELVPTDDNLVDAIWHDQPERPCGPIVAQPLEYAGQSTSAKRTGLGKELRRRQLHAAVLTDPASIAWLLNVRGADVAHTPLPLSFAVLHDDGRVHWFVDPAKVSEGCERGLGDRVSLRAPEELADALGVLGREHRRVLHDPKTGASWLRDRLVEAGADVVDGDDPCLLPKACKNEVELAGAREAHVRDGAALVEFMAWLHRTAGDGNLTEMSAAERLAALRAERDLFRDLSFATISGFAGNGAIIHYRATPDSDAPIRPGPGAIYLVDSGGQYLDGTTDVTRTVALGEPTDEQRDRFTRVLQGHIDLAAARFPEGTNGGQLDTLARAPLWAAGLDYDHGTGHGVGSFLGVHEGPQRIHRSGSAVPLQAGMILSNEPGYYKAGEYGIRIENLVAVRRVEPAPTGAEKAVLEFETLTLCPIDLALTDAALLSSAQRGWLDRYHERVRLTLTPLVTAEAAAWLEQATRPLAAVG